MRKNQLQKRVQEQKEQLLKKFSETVSSEEPHLPPKPVLASENDHDGTKLHLPRTLSPMLADSTLRRFAMALPESQTNPMVSSQGLVQKTELSTDFTHAHSDTVGKLEHPAPLMADSQSEHDLPDDVQDHVEDQKEVDSSSGPFEVSRTRSHHPPVAVAQADYDRSQTETITDQIVSESDADVDAMEVDEEPELISAPTNSGITVPLTISTIISAVVYMVCKAQLSP